MPYPEPHVGNHVDLIINRSTFHLSFVHNLKLLLVIVFFFPFPLWTQVGNIKGVVLDNRGIAISGAYVFLPDLNRGTVSDLSGRFTLLQIPVGPQDLSVKYLGFSDIEQKVNLEKGKTKFVSIVLKPQSIRLQGVEVVTTGASGIVRALNTQKNNLNITNVVSSDQIGKFPDANIGDAVKRIPGIAIQVNQGEARNIIIRGLSPELNSVTLNGSRIPSAEGDNRNVQLDLIPSDMIQTIEVSKALTPDMDADALGGSVNLVTRTTPQGFRMATTLGSGINFISDKRIWNGFFLIGNRSQDQSFGWMLSASVNDNDFGSDNIEAQWADSFEYNSGNTDANGDAILQQVGTNPYPKLLAVQPHWIQRVRRSFAANFDYKWNNQNSLSLKTLYNWRDERLNRYTFEQEILNGDEIAPEDFTLTNGNLTRFPVLVSRQTVGGIFSRRHKNARLEDQRMQNYTLGGNHILGNLELDWSASLLRASEARKNESTAEFKSEYTISTNTQNPRFPLFVPENAENPNDLSSFLYDEIIEENKFTREKDFNLFINAALPLRIFGHSDGQLKFGARGRFKSKLRDNNFTAFDLEGRFPSLSEAPTIDYSDRDYMVGNQYQAGQFASEIWLGNLQLEDGDVVPDEFLQENYTVEEDVVALYAMVRQKFTEQFEALVGLRTERTLFNAVTNQIQEGLGITGINTAKESYTNFLPGVHLKYNLSNHTQFRLAWTNTLSRPNYVDMVPTSSIVFSDREILLGNALLKPAVAMNLDFMGEHYFESVGIISFGLFTKNIKNFVYNFKRIADDEVFGPGTIGFDIVQPLNGEEASLFGVEVAFQHRLDFLPGFAKNFALNLNYTYLSSKTEGIRDINGNEREDLNLPDTPPHLFNASLGYEDKHFSARLAANFSGAYLSEVGTRGFEDIFYDRQFFLDFSAGYALNKNLHIYLGLNNIANQPLRLYQGLAERTATLEFYERRLTFGLKYDIFKKKNGLEDFED